MIERGTTRILIALVHDTVRQSMASGVGWLLLGVSLVAIAVCLSVSAPPDRVSDRAQSDREWVPANDVDAAAAKREGILVPEEKLSIALGAMEIPLARGTRDGVRFLQLVLAGGVADTLGLLLALVWTAGFMPSFLAPRSACLLWAKPVARRTMLLGKYLGVIAFVAAYATLFVVGTWLALGVRTGIWDAAYLWSIPLLVVHFTIFYGFSVALAVVFRSTVVCVFGSIACWAMCWGLNFGRHAVVAEVASGNEGVFSGSLVRLLEFCYWLAPKPADLGMLLYQALDGQHSFGQVDAFRVVQANGHFHALASVVTSLAFALVLALVSAKSLEQVDY